MASTNKHYIGVGFQIGRFRIADPANRVGYLSDGFLDFVVEVPVDIFDGIGDDRLDKRKAQFYHFVLIVNDFLFIDNFLFLTGSYPHYFYSNQPN